MEKKSMELNKDLVVIIIKDSMRILLNMREIGLIIFKMEKALWNLQMVRNIMDNGRMVREMVKESIFCIIKLK